MRKRRADGCGVLQEWMLSADSLEELSARVKARSSSQNETVYAMFDLETFSEGIQAARKLKWKD
jgi:hypothetical protein